MGEAILRFEGVRIPQAHPQEGTHEGGPEGPQLLDWELAKGARIHLKGEAGSGASELLRMAAGVTHPSQGRILLGGIPLDPYDLDHPFLRRGALGWIPSGGGLLVNQDLLSNVALPLRFLRGMKRRFAEELAKGVLETAGLGACLHHRPHTLEPRERWMATIARTMLMEPELWIIERPAGDLDRRTRKNARRILDLAAQRSETTFVVMGEGAWIPEPMDGLKLDNGAMVPEVAP